MTAVTSRVTSLEKLAKTVAEETETNREIDKEVERKKIEVDLIRFSPKVNFAIGNRLVTEVLHPFRWDLNNVTGHGSLVNSIRKKSNSLAQGICYTIKKVNYHLYEFMAEFELCVAQTLALSYGADLLFLGRSPECMYDYLCGVYREDESLASKLKMMHFSMRNLTTSEWREQAVQPSSEMSHIMSYMTSLGLDPKSLLSRKSPIAIVDFVFSGETLDNLLWLIHSWTTQLKYDWHAVRQKLMIVAIRSIRRVKTIPKGVEWRQRIGGPKHWHTVWTSEKFWRTVADKLRHMEESYPFWDWGRAHACKKRMFNRLGLNTELFFYEHASQKEGRESFVSALTQVEAGMRQDWYRSLVTWLKGNCARPMKLHDNIHKVNMKGNKKNKVAVKELGKREALRSQERNEYKDYTRQSVEERLEEQQVDGPRSSKPLKQRAANLKRVAQKRTETLRKSVKKNDPDRVRHFIGR